MTVYYYRRAIGALGWVNLGIINAVRELVAVRRALDMITPGKNAKQKNDLYPTLTADLSFSDERGDRRKGLLCAGRKTSCLCVVLIFSFGSFGTSCRVARVNEADLNDSRNKS